jgi:hypothetical protein
MLFRLHALFPVSSLVERTVLFGTGAIGPVVADVPSGLNLTPPHNESKEIDKQLSVTITNGHQTILGLYLQNTR